MFEYLPLVELVITIVMPVILLIMGRKMWALQATFDSVKSNAEAAKQNAWDNTQALREIQAEIARLREEHKEIQGQQMRADENLSKFADAVSSKVETIMRDHSEHEVGQAKIESKLDELIRRQK